MTRAMRCMKTTSCGIIGLLSRGRSPRTSKPSRLSPSRGSSGRFSPMLATERRLQIKQRCGPEIERIMPLELDGQTIRLILYLQDGTNLRLTEQWTLFSEPKIGAILEIQDQPDGLTVEFKRHDPLDFWATALLDLQPPLSRQHRREPPRRAPAGR